MSVPQKKLAPAVIPVCSLSLVILAIVVRLFLHFGLTDDAFITFRYARNLAQGLGFVYNEGERVLGTTTPLFTLILALPGAIFGTKVIPDVAVLISYVSDGILAALCFLILLEVVGNLMVAVGGALLFVAAPDSIMHVASGMETALFTALIYSSLYCFMKRKDGAAFALSGLAILVRPEGVLVFAAILFCALVERKKAATAMRHAAIGILVTVPWVLFATLYFGSPISHSVRAKAITYGGLGEGWAAAREILTYWSSFFTKGYSKDVLPTIALAAVYAVMFAAGTYYGARRQKRFLAVALFVAAHCVSYAIGNPMMFSWYFVPLVPGIVIGVAMGMFFAAEFIARTIMHRAARVSTYLIFCGVTLILFLTQLGVFLLVPGELPSWAQRAMIPAEREETYRLAAMLVARQIEPGATVAANEVGVIGYYLDGARILDVAGLISPQVLTLTKDHLDERNLVTLRLLEQFKPDYIMSLRGFFAEGVLDSEDFQQEYEQLVTLTGEEWGRDGLLVFKKRS